MKLHNKIFLGLISGLLFGGVINAILKDSIIIKNVISYVTEPIGKMWLSALIMVVIPLILSTIALGIAHIGDTKKIGKIGLITFCLFICLSVISSFFGITAMNIVKPGYSLKKETQESLIENYKGETENAMGLSEKSFGINLLIKIVPRNPVQAAANGDMLAIIFFAVIVGIALGMLPAGKAKPLIEFFDSISNVTLTIIDMVMKFAPYAVFCLIFNIMAMFGIDIIVSLFGYFFTVIFSMILFVFLVYPLILFFIAKQAPISFFKKSRIVTLTAFTTSSSNATLPTTIKVAQDELGISEDISGFVLPLGATMNMNGTALFEGATILFLAQVFGVELSLAQQFIVVIMCVVAAIGVSGIPGGSIPFIMMILGMLGIPVEGIAIILGLDRILDMCRTTLNVLGDLIVSAVVNRFIKT